MFTSWATCQHSTPMNRVSARIALSGEGGRSVGRMVVKYMAVRSLFRCNAILTPKSLSNAQHPQKSPAHELPRVLLFRSRPSSLCELCRKGAVLLCIQPVNKGTTSVNFFEKPASKEA
jgi:hypothetical protein